MNLTRMGGAVLTLLAASACAMARPAPVVIPPPAPMPAPPADSMEAPPADSMEAPLSVTQDVCILRNGTLVYVPVSVSGATGAMTYGGMPFPDALPPESQALKASWYVNNEPLYHGKRAYRRDGSAWYLEAAQLSRVSYYKGVPLFVRAAAKGAPGASSGVVPVTTQANELYVYVAPECRVQRYKRS